VSGRVRRQRRQRLLGQQFKPLTQHQHVVVTAQVFPHGRGEALIYCVDEVKARAAAVEGNGPDALVGLHNDDENRKKFLPVKQILLVNRTLPSKHFLVVKISSLCLEGK
jgi:hypothetical protein